ncbi:hypothetical protein [Candidatus Liberibacter sp.]|uniref:hypothetical protein n=1 Tax=Candidatus Liberibacter sp. TaxID=34022 RepID=UPI0015F630CA|nr:hypothetical protein [Candidatus Liberibacter sp.]MBA5723707.1 hypothetical protein [Candidatus Liberibacter sp.]
MENLQEKQKSEISSLGMYNPLLSGQSQIPLSIKNTEAHSLSSEKYGTGYYLLAMIHPSLLGLDQNL